MASGSVDLYVAILGVLTPMGCGSHPPFGCRPSWTPRPGPCGGRTFRTWGPCPGGVCPLPLMRRVRRCGLPGGTEPALCLHPVRWLAAAWTWLRGWLTVPSRWSQQFPHRATLCRGLSSRIQGAIGCRNYRSSTANNSAECGGWAGGHHFRDFCWELSRPSRIRSSPNSNW
jgi:hypothetical protein